MLQQQSILRKMALDTNC